MRTRATLAALVLLCGTAGCGASADEPAAAARPLYSEAPSCPSAPPVPKYATLDFETARQQVVPENPPPGWTIEYDPTLRHKGNRQPSLAVVRTPEPVRAGAASGRFELRRDDPVINHGARAELATPLEPRHVERWYALSIYLPKSWVPDKSPEILAQWHQAAEIEGNPPLAISTWKGQWEVLAAWPGTTIEKKVGAYQTGRWTDWVVHVKWSAGADGVVQIWKDGKPIPGYENRRGPNTYLSAQGNYLKVGIYKWDWSQKRPTDTVQRVMYVDEVRIGATRDSVTVPGMLDATCYRPDDTTP